MNALFSMRGSWGGFRWPSTRTRVALVVVALLGALLTVPLAGAQPVGNPGNLNFKIVGGAVRLGAQFLDLTPKPLPECSDGVNNDGDPGGVIGDSAQDFLVDNPIDRYSIGNRTPDLHSEPDGTLTIHVQHQAPDATSNWLPAPEGPFRMSLRLYNPRTQVLTGEWTPPAVHTSQ